MPHKDPAAAAASKRAYYLAHKAEFLARSKARRLRIQAEQAAVKAAKAQVPVEPAVRHCQDCGVQLSLGSNPKWGPRCRACVAERQRVYRAENAARIAESKRAWKEANKAHVKAKDRAYALAFPERRAEARKRWDAANPGVTTAAKTMNRLARKKRIPGWLSDDDKWFIEQAYELAAVRTREFGFAWHVDHIIPLVGKTVSGLHVPTNLRVIPGVENLRKGNRVEGP